MTSGFIVDVDALARAAVELHHADQKPRELAELGRLILARECRDAIEIGTYRGGTTWFFHALGLDVTTIDCAPHPECVIPDGVVPIAAESFHAAGIVGMCDFLFIDGDHSRSAVWSDWANYHPKVRKGGLIAFHDIVEYRPERRCEVAPVWREVREWGWHPTREIVDADESESWAGIGVVFA